MSDFAFPVPRGWRVLDRAVDGVAYRLPGGAHVIASVALHDGETWAHLSLSLKSGLPRWPDLVAVRDALLGPEVEAYQVAAPASRYVNIHPGVLHLWANLDRPGGVLPRFEGEVEGVGLSI